MVIDVTGQEKSFFQLSKELKVEKFGVLDADGDWSYLDRTKEGDFAFSNGIAGWAIPSKDFPCQGSESPLTVESKTIFMDGRTVKTPVVKVLAYK